MQVETLDSKEVDKAVRAALAEDLGEAGDVTTQFTIEKGARLRANINAREEACLAGLDVAIAAFLAVDPSLSVERHAKEGSALQSGDAVLSVSGDAHSILAAERTALNFLCHMSGVATQTRAFSDLIAHTKAKISCTRKTTPGLRLFEKYAVNVGGGRNHRYGLYDAVLIKDNHIAAAGGDIRSVTEKALGKRPDGMLVEVEVDTIDQLKEISDLSIDVVLLDNMPPEILKQALELINGRFLAEASGGVTLEFVKAIAESGVDIISVGRITNSSPNIDFGLDYKQ